MPRRLIQARADQQVSRPDPPFVQQGEIDWVSMFNTAVTMTVGMLNRLQRAGVLEMTYVGALQLGARFELADAGYRRVEEAIEKTSYAPAFQNVAYFGFGHRSFLHVLADSKSGFKFIALCAGIQEGSSNEIACRVLKSLWTVVGFPEEYRPSTIQSRYIVKVCAGVFAKTPFGEAIGVMLGPYRNFLKKDKLPEASDPKEIAAALKGLFEISKGKRTRIKVIGGATCGLTASMAHWFFGFEVHVEDSKGEILFTSSPGTDRAAVHVIYNDVNQLDSTTITESTFILSEPNDVLRYLPDDRMRQIRTRVPWNGCLYRTFGQEFQDLLDLPTHSVDYSVASPVFIRP